LSFALAELWRARDVERRTIPAAALTRQGSAAAVLARQGELVLAAMPPAERREARRLLLALVTSAGTRARRAAEELLPDQDAAARRALDALVRGRLVVAGDGYELAHEALVLAWPSLRRWLDEASDARAAAVRLERAARDWDKAGRPRDGLWGD